MPTQILATLDPHRVGPNLTLTQGNLVVTTTAVCDIERAVFGTLAQGAGVSCFECQIYSVSQPAAGLANLVSVGLAAPTSSLSKYVGEEATSWGFRPTEAAVYNNGASISGSYTPAPQVTPERVVIGVAIDMTGSSPIAVWQVNGNVIFQATLTSGVFYVPAVSIGSTTVGDVSAFLNFGQNLLQYPIFTFNK